MFLCPEPIAIFNFCDRIDEDEFEGITAESRRRLKLMNEPVYLSLKAKNGTNRFFRSGIADLKKRINDVYTSIASKSQKSESAAVPREHARIYEYFQHMTPVEEGRRKLSGRGALF